MAGTGQSLNMGQGRSGEGAGVWVSPMTPSRCQGRVWVGVRAGTGTEPEQGIIAAQGPRPECGSGQVLSWAMNLSQGKDWAGA